MSHITITVYDPGSEGRARTPLAHLDEHQGEAEYHENIGRDVWPPCHCPRHHDPETGAGTHLKVAGLPLARPAEPC